MWKNIAEVVNTLRGLGYFLTRCLDRSSPKKEGMDVREASIFFVCLFFCSCTQRTHTLSFVFCFFFLQSNIYKQ